MNTYYLELGSYNGPNKTIGYPKAVIIALSPEKAVEKFMEWKGACAKPSLRPGSIWLKRILEFPICSSLQINEDEQKLACDDSLKNMHASTCWLGGVVDAFDHCPLHALKEEKEGVTRQINVNSTNYTVISWLD